MKSITYTILIMNLLLWCSCSSEEAMEEMEVKTVQASFEYSISDTDPEVILLDNTTMGQSAFTSEWDFGLGGSPVEDQPGLEEVRYENAGTYTVTLTVTNSAGSTTASKTVKVDQEGVCPDENCVPGRNESLKRSAQGFSIGAAVQSRRLTGQYDKILRTNFNNITSEWEMKMNIMYPSQGGYNFSRADEIVNYALANDMNVHGHVLIWHSATPNWVENFSGSDAEFESMVEDYIKTTVTRYKGKVRSWDVVNEAIQDGNYNLRNTIFRQRMGDDYVEKCYRWAREADPDVLLFYNDYSLVYDPGKRDAVFNLVDQLADEGLIDGVGAQLHISFNSPRAGQIQSVVDEAVSRGLLMHFSEIDIRVNPNNDITMLTSQRADAQKAKYKEVTEIYNAIPEANKFALTVWGLKDDESWLLNFWGNPEWPLLFDQDFQKKSSYYGVLEGLE